MYSVCSFIYMPANWYCAVFKGHIRYIVSATNKKLKNEDDKLIKYYHKVKPSVSGFE